MNKPLLEILNDMPEDFTVRDFLIDIQNYFLEAGENGVMFRPDVNSLPDVEEIYIGLGQSFGNFGLKVLTLEVLPDEGVEIDDLLPGVDKLACISSVVVNRDSDGVERVLLTMK